MHAKDSNYKEYIRESKKEVVKKKRGKKQGNKMKGMFQSLLKGKK